MFVTDLDHLSDLREGAVNVAAVQSKREFVPADVETGAERCAIFPKRTGTEARGHMCVVNHSASPAIDLNCVAQSKNESCEQTH